MNSSTFPALGTTATVVAPDAAHRAALAVVADELDAVDRACSRFRDDSELSAVNRAAGRPIQVSDRFWEALQAALRGARLTGGLVDPTVGQALRVAGYDRDFAGVDPDGPPLRLQARRVPGWAAVTVDPTRRTVTVPAGVELDFGATAKALCADRAARRASAETGEGVLISLGGDISVAGPAPDGGWPIGISDDHSAPLSAVQCTVAIASGGLATSSVSVRRWRRGERDLHHIIDPRTGEPAVGEWRTVSVAAASCLDANIASCAALLMGAAAPAWLEARGLPARLVALDGATVTSGGWPAASAGEPR